MNKQALLQDLTKLANKLDERGEYKVANVLDNIIRKNASEDDDDWDSTPIRIEEGHTETEDLVGEDGELFGVPRKDLEESEDLRKRVAKTVVEYQYKDVEVIRMKQKEAHPDDWYLIAVLYNRPVIDPVGNSQREFVVGYVNLTTGGLETSKYFRYREDSDEFTDTFRRAQEYYAAYPDGIGLHGRIVQ